MYVYIYTETTETTHTHVRVHYYDKKENRFTRINYIRIQIVFIIVYCTVSNSLLYIIIHICMYTHSYICIILICREYITHDPGKIRKEVSLIVIVCARARARRSIRVCPKFPRIITVLCVLTFICVRRYIRINTSSSREPRRK